MTIDTSPETLARWRANWMTEANPVRWVALIDALEEAREKIAILEAEIRVMRKLPAAIDAILNEIPAAAPPVGDDTLAAHNKKEGLKNEKGNSTLNGPDWDEYISG